MLRFAEPGKEIQTACSRQREDDDDCEETFERVSDHYRISYIADETAIDRSLDAPADRQSRRRGERQEENGTGDMPPVFAGRAPDDPQIAEAAAAFLGFVGHALPTSRGR